MNNGKKEDRRLVRGTKEGDLVVNREVLFNQASVQALILRAATSPFIKSLKEKDR